MPATFSIKIAAIDYIANDFVYYGKCFMCFLLFLTFHNVTMGKFPLTRCLFIYVLLLYYYVVASHSFTSAHCHHCLKSLHLTMPSFCLRYYAKLATQIDIMVFFALLIVFTFFSIFAKSVSSNINTCYQPQVTFLHWLYKEL